jgi:hypothetical protein
MPAVEYKYAAVAGRRSPLIPLGLGYHGRWQRVEAYVDSGAFYSVFKTGFALAIGIDWQTGERVSVQVGDGRFLPVYLHTVDIQLQQHRFSGRIGFSDQLGVSFNLIGRIPLFERFVICFDERQGILRFEPYNSDLSVL